MSNFNKLMIVICIMAMTFFSVADKCLGYDDITPASIPSEEREILIQLYNAMGGNSSILNTGWKTAPLYTDGFAMPGTECNWHGIGCVNGHVTTISLSNNSLTGYIPAAIGGLEELVNLNLSGNSISGAIPSEIGNLKHLETLILSSNQLTGNIPSSLGNLSNLKNLNINANQLNGNIPPELGMLVKLEVLNLSFNSLSGNIPPELGSITSLQDLNLSFNNLSGNIPSTLGSLTYLKYLHLGDNGLSGNIPAELGSLAQLQEFIICENQLSGNIPPELGNLKNLVAFGLSGNSLSGDIPSSLGNLTNLRRLDLSDNQLTGSIPGTLGNLKSLNILSLWRNALTGSIPPELGSLSSLTALYLSDNGLTGDIPSTIGNLTSLRDLYLVNNALTGSIPSSIGNLRNLEFLDIRANALSGAIPQEIGNLSSLQYLLISNNQLSGEIPATITNLTNLIDNGSDFRHNDLYTNNNAVIEFLNIKQQGGGGAWQTTQEPVSYNTPPKIEIRSVVPRNDGSGYADIEFIGKDAQNDAITWNLPSCTYQTSPEGEKIPLTFITDDPSHANDMVFSSSGTIYNAVVDVSDWPPGKYNIWIWLNVTDKSGSPCVYASAAPFSITINTAPNIEFQTISQRNNGAGYIEIRFKGYDPDSDIVRWIDGCNAKNIENNNMFPLNFVFTDPLHNAPKKETGVTFPQAGKVFTAVVDAHSWDSGCYIVELKIKDDYGRINNAVSDSFCVDNTAPINPVLTGSIPQKDTVTENRTIRLTWNPGSDEHSSVKEYEWSVNRQAAEMLNIYNKGQYLPESIEIGNYGAGHYYLHILTTDKFGNKSEPIHLGPWILSTEEPEPQTGSISGKVTSFDGQPISNIVVSAFSGGCNGYSIAEVRTNVSGNYNISSIPTGSYYISIIQQDGEQSRRLWWSANGIVETCEEGALVNIIGGSLYTIDFKLEQIEDTNTAPKIDILSVTPRKDGSARIDIAFRGTDADGDLVKWYDPSLWCTFRSIPDGQESPLVFVTDDPAHNASEPMLFTSSGTDFNAVVKAEGWAESSYVIRLKVLDDHGGIASAEESSVFYFNNSDNINITYSTGTSDGSGISCLYADKPIVFTFSEPMDASTINKDTFIVDGNSQNISGNVEYRDQQAIFTPGVILEYGAYYTVTLTTGIQDSQGYQLQFPRIFSVSTCEFNNPPSAPYPIAPINEANLYAGMNTLEASAFYDHENDSHIASIWQIRRADSVYNCSGKYHQSFCYTASSGDLTKYTVFLLEPGLKYVWKVAYKDSGSQRSTESPEFSFKVSASGAYSSETYINVPPTSDAEHYTMVSFVHWTENPSATTVFGTALGGDYNTKLFRIGTYNPIAGGYVEYGQGLEIVPGRAYWVYAKNGLNVPIRGVPVSMAHDIEVKLSYNPATGDGWNMIGCPNNADYMWENLQVVEYDASGNGTPRRISTLDENNPYIDPHLRKWENGKYSEAGGLMERYKGYWVRSKRENIYLIFPVSAQFHLAARQAFRREMSDSADMPPAPISGYDSAADISLTSDDSSTGCFIHSLIRD